MYLILSNSINKTSVDIIAGFIAALRTWSSNFEEITLLTYEFCSSEQFS